VKINAPVAPVDELGQPPQPVGYCGLKATTGDRNNKEACGVDGKSKTRTNTVYQTNIAIFAVFQVVPRARLERATCGLEVRCSIQLSYQGDWELIVATGPRSLADKRCNIGHSRERGKIEAERSSGCCVLGLACWVRRAGFGVLGSGFWVLGSAGAVRT
jgi:hypothetical protein